jgi:hypothetical protein
MSDLSPLSRAKQKLDVGAVRSVDDPKQSLNVAAHRSAVESGFLKRTCDDLQKRARIKPRVARDCDSLRPRFSQRIKLGSQGRHEVSMSNRIKTVPSRVFAMLLASVVSTVIPCIAAPRAVDDCLIEPKHQTPRGGHWYYRFDHNRKCWYLGDEGQQVSQTGSPRPLASSSPPLPQRQTEAAPTSLADAHAELQVATTPVTTPAEPPQWLGPAGILSPEKITEVVRDVSPSETPPAASARDLESETRVIDGQARTESRTESLPEPKATEAERVAELSGEENALDPPRMVLALLLIGLGLSTIGGCLIFRLSAAIQAGRRNAFSSR